MAKDKINDYKGAILDYNKTIQYEPNNSDAYYFRGLDFYKLNNKKEALRNYSLAIKKERIMQMPMQIEACCLLS